MLYYIPKPRIYISPALTDTMEVLDTLAHEIIHLYTGPYHNEAFALMAIQLGLKPCPSYGWNRTIPGPLFKTRMLPLIKEKGEYP